MVGVSAILQVAQSMHTASFGGAPPITLGPRQFFVHPHPNPPLRIGLPLNENEGSYGVCSEAYWSQHLRAPLP
jgi:hypothetical protein